MEAPKKIFLRQIDANLLSDKWLTENEAAYKSNVFEYTRTDYVADVFIEKALRWMINQCGVNDVLSSEMIEDFKNYMKG